jgi:hypothetical protein
MRQLLQLHPHKHTGKVLHHKHTSYHALFLILGLAGVFMVFLSSAAKAADYVVTATVPATIPSGNPVITAPSDGTQVSTPSITVSGTCPVANPPVIITIQDETGLLGSSQCSSGTFNVPVSLTVGTHHLTATVVTITNDTGGTSQTVAVTYLLPIVPSQPVGGTTPVVHVPRSSQPTPVTPDPLHIDSASSFIVYGYNDDAVWRGSFSGGSLPYNVTIDWGDGTREMFSKLGNEQQAFSHHYRQLRTYVVSLVVTDSAGQTTTLTLSAISPATFNHPPTSLGFTTGSPSVTRLLYQLYLGQLFLTFLLWEYVRFGRLLFIRVHTVTGKNK